MKKTLLTVLMIMLAISFAMAKGQQGTTAVGADSLEAAATAYFAEYPEGGYIIKEDVFIDKVKAGGSSGASSEVQAALKLIPVADKADFFATVNALR